MCWKHLAPALCSKQWVTPHLSKPRARSIQIYFQRLLHIKQKDLGTWNNSSLARWYLSHHNYLWSLYFHFCPVNGRSTASNRDAGTSREERCNSFYQAKGFCLTASVRLFRIPGLAVGLMWDAEHSPHPIPTPASPILLPFGLPTAPQGSRSPSHPETTCSPCDRARVPVPNTGIQLRIEPSSIGNEVSASPACRALHFDWRHFLIYPISNSAAHSYLQRLCHLRLNMPSDCRHVYFQLISRGICCTRQCGGRCSRSPWSHGAPLPQNGAGEMVLTRGVQGAVAKKQGNIDKIWSEGKSSVQQVVGMATASCS